MAPKTSAGPLREVLAAELRQPVDDEYGNTVGEDWIEQSKHQASVEARRGGEAVIAGRLQGTVMYMVTMRHNSAAAAITTDHRFRDTRSGATYNIRTAIARPRRDFIDFDVELGVADG
jgi:head-tail adaptor